MQQSSSKAKMKSHLREPSIQSLLRQRLNAAQQHLTTGISQVAEITDTSEVQLRYWENLGLLSPVRTSTSTHSGQRRYSLQEFARLLIIKELLGQSYLLTDIAAFMKNESLFIENLLNEVASQREINEEHSLNILNRISRAEEALFWRIFVPRVMYLSICLLFERVISSDVGLLLPVQDFRAHIEKVAIQHIDDLPNLGEVLLGWHSRSYPFCTFLVRKLPMLNPSKRYMLISLDWPLNKDISPKSTYLIVEERFVHLLEGTSDNARQVAGRFLKFLQETTSNWRPFLQSDGDFFYHSPDFKDYSIGDRFQNEMAERLIQLGGIGKVDQKPRWRFCCVLLPNELLVPLKERSLVVQAQSKGSPHRIGETSLPPNEQRSISIKAYQSGNIIYRPSVAEQEPDIAWLKREGSVRSAIAVPIERKYGQPVGVLYIASDESDAFSAVDQLLLRLIGRIMAEHVLTYQARSLLVERLSEVAAHPQVVDKFFSEFPLESEFISNLEKLLEQVKLRAWRETEVSEDHLAIDEKPFHHLSFIAVDIDNSTALSTKYGGDRALRNLVFSVGQRIQEWLDQDRTISEDIRLYRVYADRFCLLLKDVTLEQAERYACQLQKTLQDLPYQIEPARISRDQRIPPGNVIALELSVRLGVTGYTFERLQQIVSKAQKVPNVRVKLTRSLDEALSVGKQAGGGNITVWDIQSGKLIFSRNDEVVNDQTNPRSPKSSSINGEVEEALIEQIVTTALNRLMKRVSDANLLPPDKRET